MSGSVALIIDLESWFIARERACADAAPPVAWDPVAGLAELLAAADRLAGGRRLAVRRAYANFNVWRREEGESYRDYFLQSLPRSLLELGIEPVQVFRMPGGSPHATLDVRITADCIELARSPRGVDGFVLVGGDDGMLPVAAELRRRGLWVATAAELDEGQARAAAAWLDRFADLADLDRVQAGGGRTRSGYPAGNGETERDLGEPRHDAAYYRDVLRYGQPRLYVLAREDWEEISARVWDLATDGGQGRPRVRHQQMLDELVGVFESSGMDSAHGKVSSALFQIFKAGCFLLADAEGRVTDFHWSHEAILDPALETLDQLRARVREYLTETLRERLARRRLAGEPDPEQLEALFSRSAERRALG
ncbi:MAG: NYN domain-containing protein [Acidobacteria bacterium]|nr:MAG: NYN domain-containing protein [Acidobacteriota bacterium]